MGISCDISYYSRWRMGGKELLNLMGETILYILLWKGDTPGACNWPDTGTHAAHTTFMKKLYKRQSINISHTKLLQQVY
jgi:hypothetical protein